MTNIFLNNDIQVKEEFRKIENSFNLLDLENNIDNIYENFLKDNNLKDEILTEDDNNFFESLFTNKNSNNVFINEMDLSFFKNKLEKLSDIKFIKFFKDKYKSVMNNKKQYEKEVNEAAQENVSFLIKESLTKNFNAEKSNIVSSLKKLDSKALYKSVSKVAGNSKSDLQFILKKLANTKEINIKNIAKSLLLLYFVIFVGTYLQMIIGSILITAGVSLVAANVLLIIITIVIIAPITEEVAKFISIKSDFSTTFLIVFNTFEFTKYVRSLYKTLGIKIIIMRIAAIIMHYSTSFVQSFFISKEKNKLGLFLGILIHSLWNGFAIWSGRKEIMRLMSIEQEFAEIQ
jgi:hypothetical protein